MECMSERDEGSLIWKGTVRFAVDFREFREQLVGVPRAARGALGSEGERGLMSEHPDGWRDHLTVGALRARLAKMPDGAPVYFERITDFYFDGKARQEPWAVLTVTNATGSGEDDQFVRAWDAQERDGRALIFGHY